MPQSSKESPAPRFRGVRLFHFQISYWQVLAFVVSMLVVAPLSVLSLSWTEPAWDIWKHLSETLLNQLLVNTLILVFGVFWGTLILGVSLAWLTGVCEFPGRKFFTWALLLPLAMPTYVLAFVTLGLFDFSGPIQTTFREWFGQDVWFPEFRSSFGVIVVMSLALYPYVYLLSRNAFKSQGKRALEAAQSLGCSSFKGFFNVVLPMSRPWIAGGLSLVLMEALADFGAVSIFNYDTFTTAIYKTWFGFFSLSGAAQLSSLLVAIVFIFVFIEQSLRKRMRFSQNRISPTVDRINLSKPIRWLAFAYSFLVLAIAFLLPIGQLVKWVMFIFHEEFDSRYLERLSHSLVLGLIAALLIVAVAILLAYTSRRHSGHITHTLIRVSTLGYALPGTVLAVGIFIPVAWFDNLLIDFLRDTFNIEVYQILKGTIFIMLLAYMVRFMAVGFKSLDSSMHRVTNNIDEASRLMGLRGIKLLMKVHIPILRGGILTALTLVFVDVMKEMPITLMTRPFGWDTLAVKIFELTSEGDWERASLPALTLVLTGLLPIVLLMRGIEKK
jgi:iron(III) transport system permease protein